MKLTSIRKNLIILCVIFFQSGFAQQNKDSTPSLYSPQPILKHQFPDTTSSLVISSVRITGNKKTHPSIILRELPFKVGEKLTVSVKEISDMLRRTQQLIYNTNLFSSVDLAFVSNDSTQIVLLITVTERLYFYPVPQFRLIDRNFNEWWKTFDADPNRTIYGIRLIHNNLSGAADKLSITAMNGYLRNFSIGYSNPYLTRSLSKGFAATVGFSQKREFPYATSTNNKLVLSRFPGFENSHFTSSIIYQIRKGLYNRHFFQLQFNQIQWPDSFTYYHPGFVNSTANSSSFADVSYTYQHLNLDNINYPLRGKAYAFSVANRGLGFQKGLNMSTLDISYRKYFQQKHYNFSIQLFSKIKIPFKQSYLNQRMLGYGDLYLRGLEYYVIDGVVTGLAKSTIRKKVLSINIPLPFRINQISSIPLKSYLKAFADAGYVRQANNYHSELNNRFLYSGGLGIDLLSLYDLQLGIDYSINQLGESGFFLHTRGFF